MANKVIPVTSTEDVEEANEIAPLKIDVEENDFVPDEGPRTFDFTFSELDVAVIGNALSLALKEEWIFSRESTIDDDVQHAHAALELLKRFNAGLPPELQQGYVAQQYIRVPIGDIYIDAMYRITTRLKGKVIAVAQFDPTPDSDHVVFKLFDPVCYPNARQLSDCLGDAVPLEDISAVEEVEHLSEEEKDAFAKAIQYAWVNHY